MTTNGAALSKIKKKLLPTTDGQDTARLRTAVVSAIGTDGKVSITLNGATVTNVPTLGGAVFAVGTVVQLLSYRGSLLILGGSGLGAQPARLNSTDNLNGSIGTTYTNNAGGSTSPAIFGVAFIAPPSGKVFVAGRALAGTTTAGAYSFLDFEIKTGSTIGSGSVVRAVNDVTSSVFQSSTASQQGPLNITDLVTGLTPGAAYNAALVYRVSAGTGAFNRRHITVLPQ
jgi:hypothetical protein